MRWNEQVLDAEENAVMRWQYRMMGGFESALWDAISRADTNNLNALGMGFPIEVGGYKKYSHVSGWFENVQRKAFAKEVA